MKSLLLSLLLLPFSVGAQQPTLHSRNKPVQCGAASEIIPLFIGQFGEKPVWHGIGKDTRYTLLVDPTNGDWSLLEYNEETACIVGTGTAVNASKTKKNVNY